MIDIAPPKLLITIFGREIHRPFTDLVAQFPHTRPLGVFHFALVTYTGHYKCCNIPMCLN